MDLVHRSDLLVGSFSQARLRGMPRPLAAVDRGGCAGHSVLEGADRAQVSAIGQLAKSATSSWVNYKDLTRPHPKWYLISGWWNIIIHPEV